MTVVRSALLSSTMHTRFARKPIAQAAQLVLLGVLVAAPLMVQAQTQEAVSASASVPRKFDIPEGALAPTISRFSAAAGVAISFDAANLDGMQSRGLQGTYTVDQGFSQLLRGSGWEVEHRGGGNYALRKAAVTSSSPDSVLPAVTVKSQLETATGPVLGLVASRSRSGTKTDTSILETPQSISVVTRDQMDAQGATTLVESLRYTPGIVAQYGNTDLRLDWLTLRGFTPPARYLDNLRLPFGARGYSQPRIDPWGLERVEVVKGPSSVLYGQATPGGLVSMISKRPTVEQIRQVELQVGSHDRKQAAFDLGGALDADGVWSYRLVGLHRESDTAYDYVSEKKSYVAPSLTFRPSNDTHVTVLGHWQSLDSPGGGGAPALPVAGTLDTSTYASLPTRTFVGEPGFDRFTNRQRFIGYEAEHRLDDTFTVRQNLRYGKTDVYTQRVQAFCLAACNPSSLLRYAWAFPEEAEMLTIDTQVQADFSTGSVRHTALVGVDFSNEKSAFDETNLRVLATPFNAYQPVYGLDSGVVPSVATHIDQKRRQIGLYAQDQMHWNQWSVVLGGRYDKANTATRTLTTASGRVADVAQDDGEFTGRAALMYNFDNGIVPYVSYSTSFQPSAGVDRQGNVFAPTTGDQIELGMKYQPPQSKALLTAALYQLTQENVLTPDPLNRSFSEQTGEVRVRGLELEARGPIVGNLEGIASYAYTDSEVTSANPNSAGVNTQGNRFVYVPEHQAALWVDYKFGVRGLAGLSIGGGARYVSSTYGDAANLYRIPGVTLFDAAIRWDLGRIDPSLKGVRLALNVSNLQDKKYVATCLASAGCYYGEGRNVYLTASYGW